MKKETYYPRPRLHLVAHEGWMNDPNGFLKAFGKYHLFGQSNPLSCSFGRIRWAHYVSEDLFHWDYLGDALIPEEPYELPLGCFSGSAIFLDGKMHLYYTGASEGAQRQCHAVSSDGIHFEKDPLNPLIGEEELPPDYLVNDFRDPKAILHEGKVYLLLAAKRKDGDSAILLFEGKDPSAFSFKSEIYRLHNPSGGMIECPDFHFLPGEGNKGILIHSVQYWKDGDRRKWQNIHSNRYVPGTLDLEEGTFSPEGEWDEVDQGFDCYAFQTLRDGERTLAVSWQGMWDRSYPSARDGYAGCFTALREISLAEGRLVQRFPRELERIARSRVHLPGFSGEGEFHLPEMDGNYRRHRFSIRPGKDTVLRLLSGKGHGIEIRFLKEEGELLVSRLGMEESIVEVDHSSSVSRHLLLPEGMESVSFDILLDGTAADILVNGGRHSFSLLYYPPKDGALEFRLQGAFSISDIDTDIF